MIALRWCSLHCDNVLTRHLGLAIARHSEALRCLNLQTILRCKKGWTIQSEGWKSYADLPGGRVVSRKSSTRSLTRRVSYEKRATFYDRFSLESFSHPKLENIKNTNHIQIHEISAPAKFSVTALIACDVRQSGKKHDTIE